MDLACPHDHADGLHVDITADGTRTRLRLDGEWDALSEPQVLTAVTQALQNSTVDLVELNLTALEFIDSAGIRCLLACRNKVHEAGRRLLVSDPSPYIFRILQITGLIEEFDLTPAVPRQIGREKL